jgi:sugar (pentulose or hexulose) kinase
VAPLFLGGDSRNATLRFDLADVFRVEAAAQGKPAAAAGGWLLSGATEGGGGASSGAAAESVERQAFRRQAAALGLS